MKHVALLRGINVGGKNNISMTELRVCFENLGYEAVSTYINSGNVLFSSNKSASRLGPEIESTLIKKLRFDSEIIKTLVISKDKLQKIIHNAPAGFGTQPEKYHSDVVFLINTPNKGVLDEFELHPEVDKVWEGEGVFYFQRLSEKRTKSRLGKIVAKLIYKSMTIRTWNTVNKIYDRMKDSN